MLEVGSILGSVGGTLAAFTPVDQSYLDEARQMQALSLGFHIPLVCFGIAFPAIVLFMEGLYLRTGDRVYEAIARRWSKVMLILFAVGVVSGTVLSFELGLLWPRWMEEFGEVFGIAFALEGLSFFVEAIFIAIYVYGWGRFSPRVHFMTGIPIVIAGLTGSLLVLGVNGWMNNPAGFTLDAAGEVTNVEPFAALFNSSLWHEYAHMYLAGYLVAGFLTAGVYAYAWLRGRRDRYHRTAMIVPLAIACLVAPVQVLVGDWAARKVAEEQPTKLAALEGLEETTSGADLSFPAVYIDGENYGISLPNLLSLLAFHDPDAEVQGLNAVAEEDRPPVGWVRNSFTVMVAIGSAFLLLAAVFIWSWLRRGSLPRSRWFYRAVVAAGPAALVALIAGWIVTEVGRQPWIVYEVMRVEEAVTGADGIPVGYASLVVLYAGLAAVMLYMLRRLARQGPEPGAEGAPKGEGRV